ncbi:MAG TPA: AAA family ATPase [Candidatus Saccharimonadales bacterium]|nr:AAA family ATPase [Candidatus Saccharimonadales bacterium]
MKLLFLYGPPAAGKYTVGSELAERTGYKLFHNHMTVDISRALFGETQNNGARASALKDQLRLDVIRTAAEQNINLIFTLAYTRGASDQFVYDVVKTVTDNKGCVCFVQLHAPRQVLYSRIGNTSRHLLGKPSTREHLEEKFARGGLDLPVLFTNNLRLDTSQLQPTEAAQRVITHFHL